MTISNKYLLNKLIERIGSIEIVKMSKELNLLSFKKSLEMGRYLDLLESSIFKKCDLLENSVENILKYPQEYENEIVNKAISEFVKNLDEVLLRMKREILETVIPMSFDLGFHIAFKKDLYIKKDKKIIK